jgi:uncharacterized protein (UPF0248 family)
VGAVIKTRDSHPRAARPYPLGREFGKGRFQIGYFDRKTQSLVHLPLERIRMEGGIGFTAVEDDGTVHSVPYHRVREVWRDGELIWSRGGKNT